MKNVTTIPPDVPFVRALAEDIFRESGGDPLALADYLIFLPTRRACLHLQEAFRQIMKGGAALLPRMVPIGDIDEEEFYFSDGGLDIPPAISALRRQLLLAQTINKKDPDLSLDQAALLAEALAQLLDEVQTERKDFSGLAALVKTRELAKHWEQTVTFLDILTQIWPQILAAEGAIDPADRRNRVLEAQAEAWRKNPPKTRVIAAGSTGSIPATADLLDVVASLPNGMVVLPGLDTGLDEGAWQVLHDAHPQCGMKKLLEHFGIQRSDVKLWDHAESPRPARVRLLQEAMRPADLSDEWQNLKSAEIPLACCDGLERLTLDYPQEEARAIALIMREALETPLKTAALVTPDRNLAERVAATLDRWGIRINDTAGVSLAARPLGGFLTDILAAAVPDASPVAFLSLLKHPLAAFGMPTNICRDRARQIELDVWRNQKRADDLRHLEILEWRSHFEETLKPLREMWFEKKPLSERITLHREVAEHAATSDIETGSSRLWRGEEGGKAAEWLNDFIIAAHNFPPLTGPEYDNLFRSLLRTVTLRTSWGLHPRLSILGPLEARLIHADLVILGGLNEGSWPPETKADPWMSRPMKADFGLPLPERRIGLAAHDFVQLASATQVTLTRSARMGGAPSVPSRFLLQVETVLRALGHSKDGADALAAKEPWQAWARALDEPALTEMSPCLPPEPRPPLASRPTQLPVTSIGMWRLNPYAIYAEYILKLRKLDPLEAAPDAADRGTIIHDVLEAFVLAFPKKLPFDALDRLLALGAAGYARHAEHPEVKAFWWPRFRRIAKWFIEKERERRGSGIRVLRGEVSGRLVFGTFTLNGRADRIEQHPDGTLGIVDYKTGVLPRNTKVAAGYEPQLPLLALIAEAGGFTDIPPKGVSEIAHWQMSGSSKGQSIKPVNKDLAILIGHARDGVENLIKAYGDPAMPYRAVPKPGLLPSFDRYAHLARLGEWGRTESDQ